MTYHRPEAARTGPEIPGLTTVDWACAHVGYFVPDQIVDADLVVLGRTAARLQAEARRVRRMIDEPASRAVPGGILVWATVCGSPN